MQVHWMHISVMRIKCAFVQSTSGGGLEADWKRLTIEMHGQGHVTQLLFVPYPTPRGTAEESRRTATYWQDVWWVDTRGNTKGLKGFQLQAVRQHVLITWQGIATPLIRIKSLLLNRSFECAQCALNSHCHECEFNANSMHIDTNANSTRIQCTLTQGIL